MKSIIVEGVSKKYQLYQRPTDRLKETFQLGKKTYHRDFFALQDITFSLDKGETVGILGKNGSGKSTLLKIISGVLQPTAGSVDVKGIISPLLELGAGFNPEYTGIENVIHNGVLMGRTRKEMEDKLPVIVAFADIGDFVYQPVKTYSSGMFARLAFATAIHIEPEILIVDEILSVGDARFQGKCMNKFKELKQQGVTILFVSHDVSAIREFCDQAIWIDQGVLKMQGEAMRVTAEYMKTMYDHEEEALPEAKAADSAPGEKAVSAEAQTAFEPINRWGTKQGAISFAELYDEKGEPADLIEHGKEAGIKLQFTVPEGATLDTISVAVSIKNKMGTDLVVSTLFDTGQRIKRGGRVEVTFSLTMHLTPGEYILVAALEDRSQSRPEYYDYIEGAKYFKVYAEKPLFGLFNQDVKQTVAYLEGSAENE